MTSALDHADGLALLRRQSDILERIAEGAPLLSVLTEVTATMEELVPECLCSILLLDAARGTLHHGAAPSLPAGYSTGIDGMRIGADAGSCGTAAYLGEAVVVEDIDTDVRWERFRPLAALHGLRSCWSTPIRARDGVVGTFAVYHERTHRPTDREGRLIERLTHLASVAIDHDRLFGALAESEERFRRAFDDNVAGMALATVDGAVTRTNQAMRELLGRPEADLLGARLDDLFAPSRPTAGPGRRTPALHECSARQRGTGRALDLVVSVSPIRDGAGVPVRLCVNVLDVTERRAGERERKARDEAVFARNAAERASRAKSDFVSALGHELRTPLQAVTGFTELLRTLDLSPERRAAALEHIDAAAAHILALLDDVLDVARIEAGALPVQTGEVDLADAVAQVLTLLGPLAAAQRVSLHDRGSAVRTHGDPRRLRQVLINIVSNAIRYNHAGGAVDIAAAAEGGRVRLTVADTGRGIAPEHLDRLFEPFDRLGAESEQGVGLGLPLARGLVEVMHGELTVASEPGLGTTVTVLLPR